MANSIKGSKRVECPSCRLPEWLQPKATETFEALFYAVVKKHERCGCAHHGFATWGFYPEWDKPVEPEWIARGRGFSIVLDPEAGCYRMDTRPGEGVNRRGDRR